MKTAQPWTTDEFLQRRFDLPEGGQWSELIEGEVVHLQPPDLDHGTVVLNLSKAFATFAHATDHGYACFDLGLQLRRRPDTILFPAACYFVEGPRFAVSDDEVTDVVPAIVIEVASTSDRARDSRARTAAYLRWGVSAVWTITPVKQAIVVSRSNSERHSLTSSDWLEEEPHLPQFRLQISRLFAVPEWWTGPSKAEK